jgi:hypothetical protein
LFEQPVEFGCHFALVAAAGRGKFLQHIFGPTDELNENPHQTYWHGQSSVLQSLILIYFSIGAPTMLPYSVQLPS